MPRRPQPEGTESYILSDAFRQAAYNIGIQALKIDQMMKSRLWNSGSRHMPKAAYDDLESAYHQLGTAHAQVGQILLSAKEREGP